MKNRSIKLFRLLSVFLAVLMIVSVMGIGALAEPTETDGQTTAESTTVPSPESTTSPGSTETTSPETESETEPEITTQPPVLLSAYYEADKGYKNEYFSGEDFNPNGIEIVLVYSNGTIIREKLESFGNYSPKTLETSTKAIAVKVSNEWIIEIPVTVSAKIVTKLEFAGVDGNFKNAYLQGEEFDPTGLKLKAHYNDGTSEIIDNSKLTVTPSGALNTTDTRIALSYGGKSHQITISVSAVKSIKVEANESPLKIGQYQVFDRSKITVTATYANGQTKVITDYTVEDGGLTTAGNGTVNITYYEKSAGLDVTVLELEGIRVTKNPDKTSYNEGDVFDPKGMEVSGIYNNGLNMYPINGYKINSEALVANGDSEAVVEITFDEFFSDTVTVSVAPIVSITVTKLPDKSKYYEGAELDFTGITVEVEYASGEKNTNFKGFSLAHNSKYADPTKLPTVSYKDLSARINIEVVPIKAILITKNPDRIIYTEGEVFDPTGMEITAYFDDNTYNLVEIGACTFTSTPLQIYDVFVTVAYKNLSTHLNVTVTDKVTVKSLVATVMPKIDYVSGQELDLTGMELTLTLSDGITKVLEADKYVTEPANGTKLYAGADTKITVTYTHDDGQVYAIELPLNVTGKEIVSLFISKMPDKLVYKEGEVFDPTGLIVRAYYNDNTTEEITNYIYSTAPFFCKTNDTCTLSFEISVSTHKQYISLTINPIVLAKIEIGSAPNKILYRIGEKFDPTGMTVNATFADGSVIPIPVSECAILPSDYITADDTTVTVMFRGKSATMNISVDGNLPPVTTEPPVTETDPPVSDTEPPVSNTQPPVTDTDTTKREETTRTPSTSEQSPETTKDNGKKPASTSPLTIIFICLILFVVALLVVLFIYYRRHFC